MLYLLSSLQEKTPVSSTAFPEERTSTIGTSLWWWTAHPAIPEQRTSVWTGSVRLAQQSTSVIYTYFNQLTRVWNKSHIVFERVAHFDQMVDQLTSG